MALYDDIMDFGSSVYGGANDIYRGITGDEVNRDLKDDATKLFNFATNDPTGKALTALGLSALVDNKGWNKPEVPKTGYQGKIPRYTAVRERVNKDDRPNSQYGQRSFSDITYVPTSDTAAVDAAREAALAQNAATIQDEDSRAVMGYSTPANAPAPSSNLSLVDPDGPVSSGAYAPIYARGGQVQNNRDGRYAMGGGINKLSGGRYLNGMSDGMADEVPANIEGRQEAALSDGEFVIPADVVSHLGNGSSNAGADVLNNMMTKVRTERTGNPKQGKQINPEQLLAKGGIAGLPGRYASGGTVKYLQEGGPTGVMTQPGITADNAAPANDNSMEIDYAANPNGDGSPTGTGVGEDAEIGNQGTGGVATGKESSLSNWAGDYVTDMLGRGWALADLPFEAYQGQRTAGASDLQNQAFSSIGSLGQPTSAQTDYTAGTFDAAAQEQYMSPYLQGALEPQLAEARRQANISRLADAGRMTQAGAFGGSRGAIMDAENSRNLQRNLADITGQGYQTAYEQARDQFNAEQNRGMDSAEQYRRYGLDVLGAQADAGSVQRDIAQQKLTADEEAYYKEMDFPYKQVQYMQSLLQGMPLAAQSYQYSSPSAINQGAGDIGGIMALFDNYLNPIPSDNNPASPPDDGVTDPDTGATMSPAPTVDPATGATASPAPGTDDADFFD